MKSSYFVKWILLFLCWGCHPDVNSEGNPILGERKEFVAARPDASLDQVHEAFETLKYQYGSHRFDSLYNDLEALSEQFLAIHRYREHVHVLLVSGAIARELGNFEMSHYYLDSALQWVLPGVGLNDTDTLVADVYLEFAQLQKAKGGLEELFCYARSAQRIYENIFDDKPPQLAACNQMLGYYHNSIGNIEQAMVYHKKNLKNLSGGGLKASETLANSYRGLGFCFFNEGVFDSAFLYFQLALEKRKELYASPHPEVGEMYALLAECKQNSRNFYEAKTYLLKALEQYEKAPKADPQQIVYIYQELGSLHSNMYGIGDSQKDLYFQNKALKVLEGMEEPDSLSLSYAYGLIGRALGELGFFEKGITYSYRALQIYRASTKTGGWDSFLVSMMDNVGVFAGNKKDFSRASAIHKDLLEKSIQYLGKYQQNTGYVHFHLGIDATRLENYAYATENFLAAREVWKEIYHDDHFLVHICDAFLAGVELEQANYIEALKLERKTIPAFKESIRIGYTYKNIADIHVQLNDLDSAYYYYQKSLGVAISGKDSEARKSVPLPSEKYTDGLLLISALKGQMETLLHKESHKEAQVSSENLDKALKIAQAIKLWVEFVRLEFDPGSTREELLLSALGAYEQGVKTVMKLLETKRQDSTALFSQAFDFFQARKSHSLLESTIEAKAQRFANIPMDLLNQSVELRKKLSFYKRQLTTYELNPNSPDSARVIQLQDTVFRLKSQFDLLIERLEREYPKYFQFKYKVHTASLPEVQETLLKDKETAILEYMEGEEGVYVLAINSQNADLSFFPYDSLLIQGVDSMLLFLSSRNQSLKKANDPAYIHEFGENAYNFYNQFIQQALQGLKDYERIRSLILIPEGKLSYVPFDILLYRNPNGSENSFSDLPYLLKKYTIRYGYSSTLLMETHGVQSGAKNWFAGFAPAYASENLWASAPDIQQTYGEVRRDLLPLRSNQSEVEIASKLFTGKSFVGNQATEANFKQAAKDYKVLHMAMHALTDDQDPMQFCLVFDEPENLRTQIQDAKQDSLRLDELETREEDGRLYAHEIYNLSLNADLAVLSACNTGMGTLKKGEGIMSLARAFAYAGCPNVLMSLWQADDEATKELMEGFYKNLKKGLQKDEALRQAKLNYLKHGEILHPYFWSGFILIGDDAPIPFSKDVYYIWGGMLVFVAAVLFFISKNFS